MKAAASAARAASTTASSLASGRASRMLSAMLPVKRCGRCGTQASDARQAATGMSASDRPSTSMCPTVGSMKRSRRLATVDLPAPLPPTRASERPAGSSIETESRAGASRPGYVNETARNRMPGGATSAARASAARTPARTSIRRPTVRRHSSGGGRGQRHRRRLVEDLEGPRHGRRAGRAHVEADGQQAQRQEELGRDEQDGQRPVEGDAALQQAQSDLDRDQRDGDGGPPLQHQRGLEGRAQHVHGGIAVASADTPQVLHLLTAPPEHPQGRQTTQDVQEEGRQGAHLQEAALRDRPRAPADDDEEQDQERAGEEEHQDGGRVQQRHHGQHQQRHDHGQPAGRQVAGHVLLDGLEAPHQQASDLAAALLAQPRRPETQQVSGEVAAQCTNDALSRSPGRQLPQGHEDRAHRQQEEGRRQRGQDVIERAALQEDAGHGRRPPPPAVR